MKIWEVRDEYLRQLERETTEHRAWIEPFHQAKTPYRLMPKYEGFRVDYRTIEGNLVDAIMKDFAMTREQATHVYAKAYEDGHSAFEGVFGMAVDLAQFVIGYPKGQQNE